MKSFQVSFLKVHVKSGVVVHSFNPTTGETEAVPGQPELHSNTIFKHTHNTQNSLVRLSLHTYKPQEAYLSIFLSFLREEFTV